MEALVKKHQDLKLRKIDIVRWGSPVATQFEIDRLPDLLLYENGELAAYGTHEVLARLR